ncbi:MAG: photosynthetic reaction center subunit H [Rubrivivax sp.]
MGTGAITAYADVAQLVLYAFWIFFAGLIYYLVRENHREGYPMETVNGRGKITGWPVPKPKTYLLREGGELQTPSGRYDTRELQATPTYPWTGAPLEPNGDPMTAGVGPGSWAERADVVDTTYEGEDKIVPLRVATEYDVSHGENDPRGLPVVGADGQTGGTVRDLWLDRSEAIFRYLEVETPSGRRVLLPMNFARIKKDRVQVKSVHGRHFEGVPGLKSADRITLLEEEKVVAYYGAGTLYADPSRQEPLL